MPVKMYGNKKLTIDCYYRLLSGFLVTFTTAITITEKVSFAMPWQAHNQSDAQDTHTKHCEQGIYYTWMRLFSVVIDNI